LQILKVCGGFPLALRVIGRSLRGQSAEVLKSWVKKWCSGRSILDSDRDLLVCLQKSLDFLDNEVIKKCFLDLGLFPEDQRIPVAALIDMWAELYELDEEGIDAIANLHEITSRNLASLVVSRYTSFLFVSCDFLVGCCLHDFLVICCGCCIHAQSILMSHSLMNIKLQLTIYYSLFDQLIVNVLFFILPYEYPFGKPIKRKKESYTS